MSKLKIKAKVDVSSKTLEKGMEHAKGFLSKLIVPAVEEVGLLLKDHVSFWRLKNYIKTLNKSEAYCREFNIDPKKIPVKLLSPLIDFASLEEDEQLQDKWAILLGNLVDSEQNIQNHVFPYILSQISKDEFDYVEQVFKKKQEQLKSIDSQLKEYRKTVPPMQLDITNKIHHLKIQTGSTTNANEKSQIENEIKNLERELRRFEIQIKKYQAEMESPAAFPQDGIRLFEIANLVRLGVIKAISNPDARLVQNNVQYVLSSRSNLPRSLENVKVMIRNNEFYILTNLGELFIQACSEKNAKWDL